MAEWSLQFGMWSYVPYLLGSEDHGFVNTHPFYDLDLSALDHVSGHQLSAKLEAFPLHTAI